MAEDFMQILKKKLFEKGLASSDSLVGCNDQEIASIMNAQAVTRLPQIYEHILLTMGKEAGKLWERAVFTYPELETLKQSAQKLLNFDRNPIELPHDAFVFNMEEGIVFYYFLTANVDDNPPVYMYHEVDYTHKIVDEHLTDFFLNAY